MPAPKESEIQSAICDYLALKGYFFWRCNNGGMFRDGRHFALPKYARRGVPDIILIQDGKFIGIEVKRATGYLSPDQKEFERECKEHGAVYFVARSIDDLVVFGL